MTKTEDKPKVRINRKIWSGSVNLQDSYFRQLRVVLILVGSVKLIFSLLSSLMEISTIYSIFISLLYILTAIFIKRNHKIVWIITFVLSCYLLPYLPWGTLFGILILRLLFKKEIRDYYQILPYKKFPKWLKIVLIVIGSIIILWIVIGMILQIFYF